MIRAWDLARDTRDHGATYSERIAGASASVDGTVFVFATPNHIVRSDSTRAEPTHRTQVAVRVLEDGSARGVALDGRAVVVSDFTGTTGTELHRIAVPDQRTAVAVALTADGKTLAIGDDAGRVSVWAVGDKAPQAAFDTGLRQPVRARRSVRRRGYVAAPTATGIGVWTVGMIDRVTNIETDEVATFCFLPNSDRIVTAGRDGAVRVWSQAGKEDLTLFGHVGRITARSASPDGRTLVSGGATGEVKFWDLRTGQELLGLRRHSVPVTVIAFSGDGKLLITAGADQYAVWDARE